MDFPKSVPNVGLVGGKFVDENPVTGTPGSLIPAQWGNAVTKEILGVVQEAGLVPDEVNNGQLAEAILAIVSNGTPSAATEATAGILKLSSGPQVIAGTDDTTAVTPKKLLQKLMAYIAQATETVFGWSKVATQALTNAGVDDTTMVTPKKLAGAVQGQALIAFVTGGTAPAFTLTPVPAITAYALNQRFQVTFNAAGGTTPTLNVSGLGPRNLKQYNSVGNKIAAIISSGQTSDVVCDGLDFVVLDQLPNSTGVTPAQFDKSASLATTAFVEGVGFQFSNSSVLGTNAVLTAAAHAGSLVIGNSSSAFTVTLPLASTMPNGTAIKFFNFGAGGMSVVASGSDSISTPVAITPFLIPFGAYATFVSNGSAGWYVIDVSGVGVGQTWQNVTASRAFSATYTNATGRPVVIAVSATAGIGIYTFIYASINGGAVFPFAAGGSPAGPSYIAGTLMIPVGGTYSITCSMTLNLWWELR